MISPEDLRSQLTPIPFDKLGEIFENALESAKRVEMMPFYNVPGEIEIYQMFLDGNPRPADFMTDWFNTLDEAQKDNIIYQRCRLLDPNNLSFYEKFEIEWCYKHSIKHGEDIKINSTAKPLDLMQQLPIVQDYWVIDDKDVYLMDYDGDSQFTGMSKLPTDQTQPYMDMFETLFEQAEPISD